MAEPDLHPYPSGISFRTLESRSGSKILRVREAEQGVMYEVQGVMYKGNA